jgi:hypothetical protein
MFRNAHLALAAVLTVVTISTSANAMSAWQLWQHRHPTLTYSQSSNQQLKNQQIRPAAIHRLGPCFGNRYYTIKNGQCVYMSNIHLQ